MQRNLHTVLVFDTRGQPCRRQRVATLLDEPHLRVDPLHGQQTVAQLAHQGFLFTE
jgi:hypothetical protein